MSFRKRGEVLSRGGANLSTGGRPAGGITGIRGPPHANDPQISTNTRNILPDRGAPLNRSHLVDRTARLSIGPSPTLAGVRQTVGGGVFPGQSTNKGGLHEGHPGIKPSHTGGGFVASTGSSDLDRILLHAGLPLGCSLLVEERTTTEFSLVLCKLFAAQGIVHNRVETPGALPKSGNTHVIVVSANQLFGKELPGVYKGSKRDLKKSMIAQEESRVSVQNLSESKTAPTHRYSDLKIAWKYKLADESNSKKGPSSDASEEQEREEFENKNYNHQFDITTNLTPAASSLEMSFISPHQPVVAMLTQIDQIISRNAGKLIRIVIPSFLNPAIYSPRFFASTSCISLLHGLKSILKTYSDRCILMASASSDVLNTFLKTQIENLFDSVIDIDPFPQKMVEFLERVYKSQPNKIQHGLLHILKLPLLSDRGEMHARKAEWAFRNGRKRFEIEEWTIPVETSDDTDVKHAEPHHPDPNTPAKNTKVSLEF